MSSLRAHTGFVIGFFCLVVFVIGIVFLAEITNYSLTSNQQSQSNTNQASPAAPSTTSSDPLVTLGINQSRFQQPQILPTDPVRGADQSTVTIMEFGDFQCSDCATMQPVIDQVLKEYPNDVRHVWKDFPLSDTHAQATDAAIAARCADQQGMFWQYHDALFLNQTAFVLSPWNDIAKSINIPDLDQFKTCLTSQAQKQLVVQGFFIARAFDFTQTPVYFVNAELLVGPHTYDTLKDAIQKAKSGSAN